MSRAGTTKKSFFRQNDDIMGRWQDKTPARRWKKDETSSIQWHWSHQPLVSSSSSSSSIPSVPQPQECEIPRKSQRKIFCLLTFQIAQQLAEARRESEGSFTSTAALGPTWKNIEMDVKIWNCKNNNNSHCLSRAEEIEMVSKVKDDDENDSNKTSHTSRN